MQNKKLTIQITEEEHKKLKTLCAEKGISIKDAILKALDNMFVNWRRKD